MNEYKTKFEEAQRCINDFNMQKAKLQTENGKYLLHVSFLSCDIYKTFDCPEITSDQNSQTSQINGSHGQNEAHVLLEEKFLFVWDTEHDNL